jgi:hypothetical protein
MKCHTNVNSLPPTQLPHKFSYIVAILTHNHFELLNMKNEAFCFLTVHRWRQFFFNARLVELTNLYSMLPRCHLKQYFKFFPPAKVTRDVIIMH